MAGARSFFTAIFGTPPDDVPPCVDQANSFREVVSLQALFVTLTVALLAYVRSSPAFDVRVDLLFAVLAALPVMGLCHIVTSRVKTESGEVYVCTKPIRDYARQAMILDIAIVAAVSLLVPATARAVTHRPRHGFGSPPGRNVCQASPVEHRPGSGRGFATFSAATAPMEPTKPNSGAGDVRGRHHATGRLTRWLAAGLWWCFVGVVTADDPPQPYVEEPKYEMAPHLLGAQDGFRERLAAAGVTVLADNTGFSIGNTNGGFAQAFDYAGHGDYCVIADGGKLGVHDGLYLKLRAEHRYGETIVGNVGCFISPTLIADLPVYNSEEVYLTNVLLTQELTDAFSVFAGKMDTLDGDMNAFAHGRGKTQFSNMGFVFNPIVGATVPYSTLGAGFVFHPDDGPMAMVTVLNSTDTTATSGFDTLFSDGLLLSAAVRVPTKFFDRPGHQLLGGTWNSRTYTSIAEAYIPYPPVPTPTTRGSWCLYWNFDQVLVADPADDARGWGPFGRAGLADPNTSPINAFLSFGVGGNVPGRRRRDDTFGVGWYWASASPQIGTLIMSQFGPVGDGQGIECFYNYALTPAVRITPDVQYVVPSLRSAAPALIAGVRALVSF